MESALKWAFSIVESLPPVPVSNLLAFLIIALAVAGLVRKALRTTPEPQPDPVPMVMLNAGSVYTILTNLEISVARLERRAEVIETMLRRRNKPVRNRKKKASSPTDPQ